MLNNCHGGHYYYYPCLPQIAVMQRELQDLQPKLIETSEETKQLIVVIEAKTLEVEAVKSVVEADEAVAGKAAMEAKAIKV